MIVKKGNYYVPQAFLSKPMVDENLLHLTTWIEHQQKFYELIVKLYHDETFSKERFGRNITFYEAIRVAQHDLNFRVHSDLWTQEMMNLFQDGVKRKRSFHTLCN
jgi:hypothetical protein